MPGQGKVVLIFLTNPLDIWRIRHYRRPKKKKRDKQGKLAAGSASKETGSGTQSMCFLERPLVLYPETAKKFTEPSFPKSRSVFKMTDT